MELVEAQLAVEAAISAAILIQAVAVVLLSLFILHIYVTITTISNVIIRIIRLR